MSVPVMLFAMIGFTSCDDDDDPVVTDNADAPALVLPDGTQRVKVGQENRVAINVIDGAGVYQAYSLNPAIADVVSDDAGTYYIVGIKNGTTDIVVSDAASQYKRMSVSVYTTETMTLNKQSVTINSPLGHSADDTTCSVALGNGDYTAVSNNDDVSVAIDEETGEMTITARGRKAEYSATITVTDYTNLTASVNVTVTPSFDPFSATELAKISAITIDTVDYNDGNVPYYYRYYLSYGYGSMIDETTDDGNRNIGYLYSGSYYGSTTYSSLRIVFPQSTAVGTDVAGTLYYAYYNYDEPSFDGTVRVLTDDATKTVVIWSKVDMENETIDRAYVVRMK
jgi:hypothetical protein